MLGNVDRRSYATAAELPSELVRRILDEAVIGYPEIPTAGLKHGLSAYSLTCRHWAEVTRPILFSSITLKQPDDIAQLFEFLDSGVSVGPTLSGCITRLALQVQQAAVQAAGAVPRVHHYYRLIKRLPALRSIEMSIMNFDNVLPVALSGHLEIRALLNMLSSSLPRTLPGAIFPINSLTLSGLRMRSVTDLVRSVNSLPTVRYCNVIELTFGEDTMTPRPLVHRRTSRLQRIYAHRCDDESLKSQLKLCSMIAHARERLGYDVDAWASVHAIMLTVPDGYLSVTTQLMADSARESYYSFPCIRWF
jgi:hypothetical protein